MIVDDNHTAGYQSNLQFFDSLMYWKYATDKPRE